MHYSDKVSDSRWSCNRPSASSETPPPSSIAKHIYQLHVLVARHASHEERHLGKHSLGLYDATSTENNDAHNWALLWGNVCHVQHAAMFLITIKSVPFTMTLKTACLQ